MIGLTGNICCGKSTVSKYFEGQGIIIIDADKIGKYIISQPEVIKEIGKLLGNNVITTGLLKETIIDTKKVSDIIFNDKEKLKQYNNLIFPKIIEEIKNHINLYDSDKNIILDAPLLLESKLNEIFNIKDIWVVTIPERLQLKRLQKRNGYTFQEGIVRINSQMSSKEKLSYATEIIDNSQDLSHLYDRLDTLSSKYFK